MPTSVAMAAGAVSATTLPPGPRIVAWPYQPPFAPPLPPETTPPAVRRMLPVTSAPVPPSAPGSPQPSCPLPPEPPWMLLPTRSIELPDWRTHPIPPGVAPRLIGRWQSDDG